MPEGAEEPPARLLLALPEGRRGSPGTHTMHRVTGHSSTSGGAPLGALRGRLLVTAGPTHEPIDAVRFIGNRSSGRLGIALAEAAARRGWDVRILLGPTCLPQPTDPIRIERFQTATELQRLLAVAAAESDVVVMAAAVADFRPRTPPEGLSALSTGKLRRGDGVTLDLEATPDLLAELAQHRRAGQFLVGFALEPGESLLASARAKLQRKGVDLIVANPLETMDAASIDAVVLDRSGGEYPTPGRISKQEFAVWLLELIEAKFPQRCAIQGG